MVLDTQSIPLLQIKHLQMKFGGITAIKDLNFFLNQGEITSLIGPNGAGKTTVFNCITGFYRPTKGQIKLCHSNKEFYLEQLPDFKITRDAKVARSFQNIRLFSGLTVFENLLMAQHNSLMCHSNLGLSSFFKTKGYKVFEEKSVEKSRYWLEKIGLLKRSNDLAGSLSYGDQRHLEIVRAMCTNPKLLCLDEPAAGLNPKESAELNVLLYSICKDHNTAILLIEHDMSVVMNLSDHVVVLEYGAKIANGKPEEIKNDPKVISAYLGHEQKKIEMDPYHRHTGALNSIKKPEILLKIENLSVNYGPVRALNEINLEIREGEIVTLVGANGAGKSTLMMSIFGMPTAQKGQIIFNKKNITNFAAHDIAKLKIAQCPEGRRIFSRMNVLENLQIGSLLSSPAFFAADIQKMFHLFPRLKERLYQRSGTLSGGEQQMLAIARALMSRPKLLLLDEPSLGLAPLIVKQIFKALAKINKETGLTIFLVEQNALSALKLADRGYVLRNGSIVSSGNSRSLLSDPDVRSAYLEGAH